MTDKKPHDSNTVTPYFTLKGANEAIAFYKDVLGATEDFRMDGPDGKVMHASLKIGDSQIMLTEERPDMNMGLGVSKASIYVYVDNPDETIKRAKAKGAKILMEPADMFYGDRTACFMDPFGQVWTAALHIEDVSTEEMKRRGREMFANKAA